MTSHPQGESTSSTAGPRASILLRPPLAELATALAVPGVTGGDAGPGWAGIRVDGRQIRLGVEALWQAAGVAERDRLTVAGDEDDWRSWLQAAATDRDRLPAARRAIEQVAAAAAVAALPRPVPGASAGAPRITLRISGQWFDDLVQAAPSDVAIIGMARDELARFLGIPLPAVDIRAEELPSYVFGLCLGDLVLPLRATEASAPPSIALHQIAQGLVIDVRRWADALVDPDTVEQILTVTGEMLPDTVRVVRELLDPRQLLDAIRALLAQRVPVAAIDSLLELLLNAAVTMDTNNELVSYLRVGLSRQLAAAAGGGQEIPAYVLTRIPESDEWLDNPGIIALSNDPWRDTVLMTPPGSAVRLREMTRAQFPDLLVIAWDELPSACRIFPLAVLDLSEADSAKVTNDA